MSSTPSRLKYSKRLAAIGAVSAAVLTLGTASAALVTIDANELLGNDTWDFHFVPNGSSYVINSSPNPIFPGIISYCNLELISSTPDLQWDDSLLAGGAIVDSLGDFDTSRSFTIPAEGETVYGGYRYTPNSEEGGTDSYYGYVSITGSQYGNFTVDSYTYESTPNTPITIGAVPEPSAALLAFAGAGLFFRRRRA